MTWYDQADKRLKEEIKQVKGQKEGAMKSAVQTALLEFCRQNEEFAQAVAQGKSFSECMTAVAKGVGSSISDMDAYGRAVKFYFDGAQINVTMTIQLELAPCESPSRGVVLDLSDFF